MSDESRAPGWIVEVYSDGIGARHRRYIVGAIDHNAAIRIARAALGPDVTITSTSSVSASAFGVAKVKDGDYPDLTEARYQSGKAIWGRLTG